MTEMFFNTEIEIAGRKIGSAHSPYIIAEISGNHNGDIERAFELIKVAKEAGADAVKFQTYTPDSLTIDSGRSEFTLDSGTWAGRNLYELYEEAHTPYEWFPKLFDKARELGIVAFSSPFDIDGVEFLGGLDVPAFKIASNEFGDWPLIEAVLKTGKPVILSTGTATKDDVAQTVEFIRECGGRDVVILHCVSAYPAPPEEAHLETLIDIARTHNVLSGFSDHTLGTAASVAAVALGACVIEKHITLDRNDGGPDSSFSLEPEELKTLCHDARWAWEALQGGVQYGGDSDLKGKGIFTRQYWSIADIRAGDVLSEENIKSIRAPADAGGVAVKHYRDLIGQVTAHDLKKHEPVTWDLIKAQEKAS